MRRLLSVLILFSLILCCVPAASAESASPSYPILPDGHPEDHMPQVIYPEFISFSNMDVRAASAIEVMIIQSGDAPDEVTWTATASGGDGNYQYAFYIMIDDGDRSKFDFQPYSENNSFSFYFPMNGDWDLRVYVQDGSGQSGEASLTGTVNVEGLVPLEIVSVDSEGEYITDTTTWTVNAVGGNGNYSYLFYLLESDSDLGENVVVSSSHNYQESNSFSYQFLANGNYELLVWVNDENDNGDEFYTSITVDVDGYQTVYEKVEEIVAQCRAEGNVIDYEIALWLHDWLTQNANYDYEFNHYHADGVLFGGTGVCDSYSKAYLFLLREAGVPVIRITSYGHSWNAVQLGGEWYNVDVTWDDPNEGGGYENHVYCFIPDEVIEIDPDHKNNDSTVSCTSYDYNYYVQSGDAESWADELSFRIDDGLSEGSYQYPIDLPYYYFIENQYCSSRTMIATVLIDRLSLKIATEKKPHSFEGQTVPLTYIYNNTAEATICVDFEERTIDIPPGVIKLDAEAFYNIKAPLCVTMDAVHEIGTGAFVGCDSLWAVFIPESATRIEEGAFDTDNPHLTIVASTGSEAEAYAMAHGIRFSAIP